jgi:hypothetical protein
MNEQKPIEVQSEPQPQTQAVTVRDAVQAIEALPTPPPAPQITAAQSKIDAVANLTFKVYERASTLALTPEEIKALTADFPDEAFKTGAAGKENLIYIEHAFLRDRLNSVIGVGQWALIPRSRWAEDFTTRKGDQASRVYVEAMLVIRGSFVSESIGEMEYYPTNGSQNYGDAVEGAKTAALRRCCKEFGIGLQAWKKDWCEGWWARKRGTRQPVTQPALQRQQAPATPAAPTAQTPPPAQTAAAGEVTRFPAVQVVRIKEVHSKPGAPKSWTAFFITFNDGFADLEAATFDTKISTLASELANTNETARLTVKPGKKPGTREIVAIERANQPPPPETNDAIPMDFDADGKPLDVIP